MKNYGSVGFSEEPGNCFHYQYRVKTGLYQVKYQPFFINGAIVYGYPFSCPVNKENYAFQQSA